MQCIVMHAAGMYVYLKSFLRYKFLILDTYHLDTVFTVERV